MSASRAAMCGLVLALLPTAAGAAEEPPHRLADRALGVLFRRCANCHGGTATHGKLAVLDHAALVAPDRKLVIPGDADNSILLTRVRVGSMPPGEHPPLSSEEVEPLRAWIDAGAVPFSGNDHVLRQICSDVGRLSTRDRRYARYLSFDHLLARPDVLREVNRRRAALKDVLHHFAGKTEGLLEQVDDAGLLFRIDLRTFDWHRRPLEIVGAPPADRFSLITRFDLLLLEYPFALLPSDAQLAAELGQEFYLPSKPARPIAYLRGDWFAARALEPPLAGELRRNPSAVPPPVNVPSPVEDRPSGGTPIVPFDRVVLTPADSARFDLTVSTDRDGNVLSPGERVAVTVTNPTAKRVWVEVVHTAGNGRKTVLTPPTLLAAGQKKRFPPADRPGEGVAGGEGRELVTLFVFPEKFERGQLLRGEGLADRFVHPFYALDENGRLRDPDEDLSSMRVRTIGLQVVAEKK